MAEMGEFKEYEYLLNRANDFLKTAKEKVKENSLHIAAFCVEQFLQLYLKAILCQIAGDYPKTHSIKRLLRAFAEITSKKKEIKNFISQNSVILGDIEDSYITSCYIPKEFETEEVEEMIRFAEDLVKKINKWKD